VKKASDSLSSDAGAGASYRQMLWPAGHQAAS